MKSALNPTALFVKHGAFSGSNDRLLQQLTTYLPEIAFEVIDVRRDWINAAPATRLAGWISAAWEFRHDCIRRRRSLGEVYLRTRFMSHFLKRKIVALVRHRPVQPVFSLATQSLFDVAVSGVPHFVFTDHSHLANRYYPAFDPDNLLPPFVIEAEHKIYQHCEHVFVMGSHVKRSLGEHYGIPSHRVTVCGGGSNVQTFPPLENAEYGNRQIGFVGIDWHRKGGPVLLQAFQTLRQRVPNAGLHLVGCKVPDPPAGVVVHGRVPQTQVGAILAGISVFAFPTLMEPFGIAPIEAATMGLPVVASNIGALPDMVLHGHTGLLVPPNNPGALAQALEQIILNPSLAQQFGSAGRNHARKNFTWETVGKLVTERIRSSLKPLDANP